jgi:Flp pilus assembly protein TadD
MQPEAAMAALLRAQELNPGRVLPLRASGIIFAAQGKIDSAMRQWREALSVDPNDIMTLVAIGAQLAKQGSSQKGELSLKRAYKLAPRNPAVINGYAHALYLAGDLQSAGDIVLAGGRYYEGNPSFERIRAKILGEIR